MTKYEQTYVRENSLVALDIWHEHQSARIVELYGRPYPPFIYDVREGVADVYFEVDCFKNIEQALLTKTKATPYFIPTWLKRYERDLEPLESLWKQGAPPQTREELLHLCELATQAWIGLEVSYFVPGIQEDPITDEDRAYAMRLRERAADFLDTTDRLIVSGLRQLYPTLDDLILFLRLSEVRTGSLPSATELKKRAQHCILFNDQLFTGTTLEDFVETQHIELIREEVPVTNEFKGQTAMTGITRGHVRVLYKKSEVPTLLDGEILVTSMTTPDYLPAMKRAAAFVTDEGGVTCHAAIIAREFRKPCVIGTKFATKLLKTGDRIEVDATNGTVRILL